MARIFLLFTLVILFISPALAVPTVKIAEIIAVPGRCRDVRVKVRGIVTKIEADPASTNRAVYVLQDSSDQAIRVKALVAPRLDTGVCVVGAVAQDDDASKPYLMETTHGTLGPPLPALYLVGGALLLAAAAIFYRIFSPGPLKPVSSAQAREDAPIKRGPVITQVFRDEPVAALIAVSGPNKGEVYKLYRGMNTIGRDDNQTVKLTGDATVSRSHARVEANNGSLTITNESSTNPTRVDGENIQKREICDGNIVQIGSTRLRVALIPCEKRVTADDRQS